MTRLFLSRKDPAQEETNLAKRRFTFFRRGQSDVAPSSPTTASMSPPQSPARSFPADPPRRSLFTPVPVQKKTQSFRISVYEVRKDGDLTDTCSSSGSDQENVGATLRRRGLAEKKTARAKSPLPKSEPSPSSATRKAPQRTFSDPFLGASRESPPRGILKQGLITTASTRPAAGPTPVTSFDLEIARQSTSLTDAASATGDSKATSTPLKKLPEPSFVTKRTVSFSADVRDPNPRSPTMYSMCWGGKAGRRVVGLEAEHTC
jgi:hypothetical protein